jgi:hypothetical protein
MANVDDSFLTKTATDYADLSDFAYANWMPAGINNWVLDSTNPKDKDYIKYSKKWDDDRMADKYNVVSHHETDATGFSATLFQDKETGKYILAIRGTDSLSDWLGPDYEIGKGRLPSAQFESLVNYITQIRTILGNITQDGVRS